MGACNRPTGVSGDIAHRSDWGVERPLWLDALGTQRFGSSAISISGDLAETTRLKIGTINLDKGTVRQSVGLVKK